MSLTITNNPDGTVTVNCNGASVTVGLPDEQSSGYGFHPITDPGGDVVAHIVPDRSTSPVSQFSTYRIDQIVASYKEAADRRLGGHAGAAALKLGVRGANKIDLHKVSEEIRDYQATSGLGLELYFLQRED